ncbi:Dynamin family protein [Nocardioides exalbidus]|uniref:Dynamin family protein n=1 Tax=Nocardioides exalbidus TaxID=402596 RepID=A0A1H4JK44_9ACTN|nr:GTPase domain-containing protein [Nocardioides exalbidus]SEB46236.1 Dynamin family protein [Nocardioides exalbidus]
MSDNTAMVTSLVRLRGALQGARLPLDLPGAAEQRASRDEMVDQLEDYVIPRLMTLDAPLLAVVGGSTGAGKSTLVNSLVGTRVTIPGVLRPTTRSPVLVHHPDDAKWFGQDRLLPELERVDRQTNDPEALQLVASTAMSPGLAILDAPDIDSVEERNRVLAAQLLAAADLWLFVTSAARYADQVPWEFLRKAAERSAAVAIVLDRTPADAVATISTHLARMLASRGLKDSPLFSVEEGEVSDMGLLPSSSVIEIRQWLQALAEDQDARQAVVQQTLDGAIRTMGRRTHTVADAETEQIDAVRRLRDDANAAYDRAVTAVSEASADGTLLRGEVLARWQEFVGTGELLRTLETKVGWIRDRVVNAVKGKPQQAERVTVAVESGLETLILEHAEAAAERAEASWRGTVAGQGLLADAGEDLGRASRDFRRRAERAVRDWQGDVLEMVRQEGADKRSTARFLAFGVNGLSVALMVVVFAHTAGVSGAEVGIAGGSAVLGQKLLEAVFGDQAVRTLAERARQRLETQLGDLLDGERRRYTDLLDSLEVEPESPERMRSAARKVDDLRYAATHPGEPAPSQPGQVSDDGDLAP